MSATSPRALAAALDARTRCARSLPSPSPRSRASSAVARACRRVEPPTTSPRPVSARRRAAAAAACVVLAGPAHAELNAAEANRGGEFNRGSAKQFGGYDLVKVDITKEFGEDLRLSVRDDDARLDRRTRRWLESRSLARDVLTETHRVRPSQNFTGADLRFAKLRGANLRGAYMMKMVAPEVDFTGADLSDALMDRAVLVKADFTNAILNRVVLTSSDLEGAIVDNADFTDALLDAKTQQALCKTAAGKNPETGVSTRASLGCAGGRARVSSPSRYMSDDDTPKPKAEFDESRFSMYQ